MILEKAVNRKWTPMNADVACCKFSCDRPGSAGVPPAGGQDGRILELSTKFLEEPVFYLRLSASICGW